MFSRSRIVCWMLKLKTCRSSVAEIYLFYLFTGASGPVGISEKGERVASYSIQSFLSGMRGERVGNYFGTTGELQLLNKTIIWAGGSTKIPRGRPVCGFDNEFCKEAVKGIK